MQTSTDTLRNEALASVIELAEYGGYKCKAEAVLKDATIGELLYIHWGISTERHYMVMKIAAEFTGEMWQVRPLIDQRDSEHEAITKRLKSLLHKQPIAA